LNERNEVAECTSANVFCAHGTKVSTPPLSSGCLPGVTRSVLLEEIQIPGVEIRERVLLASDLESADEVFVTSTTRELLPVTHVEGLHVRGGSAMCSRLHTAFRGRVADYVRAHARNVLAR